MSMSFDRDLTIGQQEILEKFFDDRDAYVAAKDARNALFESLEMNSNEMGDLARALKQPVKVELHDIGEVKEMANGDKYKVTSKGWIKV